MDRARSAIERRCIAAVSVPTTREMGARWIPAGGRKPLTTSPMARVGLPLCRWDEMREGESRGFDPLHAGRDALLVVRHEGRLHAWRDACPHARGAPLAWRKDPYLNAARTHIV